MSDQGGQSQFVNFEGDAEVVIARLVGPSIDDRSSTIIAEETIAKMDEAASLKWLVLDARAIEYMNSNGIGRLVEMHHHAKGKKAKIALHRPSDPIMQILKITKMHKLFVVTEDEDSLRKKLGR